MMALATVELFVVIVLPADFSDVLSAKSRGCRLAPVCTEAHSPAGHCTYRDRGRTAHWLRALRVPGLPSQLCVHL